MRNPNEIKITIIYNSKHVLPLLLLHLPPSLPPRISGIGGNGITLNGIQLRVMDECLPADQVAGAVEAVGAVDHQQPP